MLTIEIMGINAPTTEWLPGATKRMTESSARRIPNISAKETGIIKGPNPAAGLFSMLMTCAASVTRVRPAPTMHNTKGMKGLSPLRDT